MSNNDQEIMYPNGKVMKIGGEEFTIKPFVIRERTQVLNLIVQIFREISADGSTDFKGMKTYEVFEKIINVAGVKLLTLYELVLKKDKDWIEANVTLPEEVDLFQTIWEMNKFPLLISQIQKMIAKAPKLA